MCVGRPREDGSLRRDDTTQDGDDTQRSYSHIFIEAESQLALQRAMMLHRLIHDPFYIMMNINSQSRVWMLRHLVFIAEYAERRYKLDLLQFFELIGREDTLFYLRYKNAPVEIIVMWERMHPRTPPADGNQAPQPPSNGRA